MEENRRIRVGVIGTGHLGNFHARNYAEIPAASFVGVYDVDGVRSRAIATEYGVTAFTTLDDLLREVDAVSIATVTSTHYGVAERALMAGVHVLVEKPMTTTVAEADGLIALAKEKNLRLQVGHVERFNPAILALESYSLAPMFIESHRLAQFNPRGTDVTVVLDLMIHDIDIILSLVRSPVAAIEASGVAVVSDSVDIANARLQFENGCVANVTASRISQKKMRKMRMFQNNGYISIDFAGGVAEVFRLLPEGEHSPQATLMLGKIGEGKKKRTIVYEQPEVKETNALKVELQSFLDCVRTGKEPLVSGTDGRHALDVAQRIIRKIEGAKIVM